MSQVYINGQRTTSPLQAHERIMLDSPEAQTGERRSVLPSEIATFGMGCEIVTLAAEDIPDPAYPEGFVIAQPGSFLYIAALQQLWLKTSGVSNTGWTALIAALVMMLSLGSAYGQALIVRNQITTNYHANPDLSVIYGLPNTFQKLSLGTRPLFLMGIGDSVGDDTPLALMTPLTNAYGANGGYITVTPDGTGRPLTYGINSLTTTTNRTTNWFSTHMVVTNGSEVTNSANGGFIDSDTFRVAHVVTPQGGSYKVQIRTNGGSWGDITGTINTTGTLSGAVTSISTNRGFWQTKVVGLAGTNFIVGSGLWASNAPGIRLTTLWEGGTAFYEMLQGSVSTNITVPILADIAPDLVFYKGVDLSVNYTNYLGTFRTLVDLCLTNSDIVFIGCHPIWEVGSVSNEEVLRGNTLLRRAADTNKWNYIDGYTLFKSTNELVRLGWSTDGVHLTSAALEYAASHVLRELALLENTRFNAAGGPSARTNILTAMLEVTNQIHAYENNTYYSTSSGTTSNYSRLSIGDVYGDTKFYLLTVKSGTGATRGLRLGVNGIGRWEIDTGGNLAAVTDNLYQIGGTNASRPIAIYLSRGIVLGANGSFVTNYLTGSNTLTFTAVSAQSHQDQVISVTGCTSNDAVQLAIPSHLMQAGSYSFTGFSSNDAVWVRMNNYSSGTKSTNGSFRVLVTRW